MGLPKGLEKLRSGFHPTFWVANGMELFERLAYYGQQIVFMIYMRNQLGFTEAQAGQLSGLFGGLIYLLPILGGTLADRWGFRRAFTIAFSILALGYFLIGSVGMSAFAEIYGNMDHYWLVLVFLIFTAFGGSFIKPSVLGTVAVTSKEETKSLGFAIYYWLVNAGAMLGPTIAYFVRDSLGNQFVYMVSAVSCLAMLVVNLLFYKEVRSSKTDVLESFSTKLKNLFRVMGDKRLLAVVISCTIIELISRFSGFILPWYLSLTMVILVIFYTSRFMKFLLIYSLYWIIFWQEFIIIPYYITDFISASAPYEIIQSWAGAGAIILLQIPINRFTKNIPTRKAILVGFAVSSLIWIIIAIHPSIPTIAAGIVAFSIGEMIQAPRYYEYISEIAPPGQQGLFQGYAFLPIAIARFVGDPIGGWLYQTTKGSGNMNLVWLALVGIGVGATILMAIYNYIVGEHKPAVQSK